MRRRDFLAGGAAAVALPGAARAQATEMVHGLWVWDGRTMVMRRAEQERLLAAAQPIGLTDIYLALAPGDYRQLTKAVAAFVSRMTAAGLKVWALDGSRGYFSDADGPGALFAHAAAMLAYNDAVAEAARFVGFQTDNEPQDLEGFPAHFHSGLASSQLTAQQAAEREALLLDWLRIQGVIYQVMRGRGLRTGAAMVFFTEDYLGEPLTVVQDGVRRPIGPLMMGVTDDYVVMSYNTDPANAASRVVAQAAFASQLPPDVRPRVLAAMEVNPGVGATVSYGDTPGKASKAAVLSDMAAIIDQLKIYPAFAGVSLHAWRGWQALP